MTGAADPTTPLEETIPGKLPQRRITTLAAKGYSSYGNQIGLTTGFVDELYHPGYAAKRMEIGAVLGAAPAENVVREVPLPGDLPLEKVRAIRRSAKSRVFVTNALRALRQVSPTGNIRDIPFVVLVGGSSLDFEIPQLVTDALAHYRLVAGRGNIRGCEGPRNAVASGLLLSWQKGGTHGE